MISVLNRFFKSHFLARHALLALAGFIIPSMAAAEWTYLPLPYALRNSTIVTTGNVRARCSGVGVSSDGSRYCERSFAPPTFANENEVVETVPAGRTLKLLEVHYDQDGFALRVVGDNEPFWIFQPHQGPSVVSSEGQPIEIPLQNIYTAYLAGDIAAILGHQDVQLQCFPGMTVIDQPLPEVVQERPTPAPTPAPTGLQVPEFDFHAASAGNKFSPNCQAFIGASGEYGEWGRIIENELKNSDHLSIFLSDQAGQVRNMDRICPNFTRLSREQKIRFWVWAFMSIAQVESTCQSGLQASEPSSNGYFAQGLLWKIWMNPLMAIAVSGPLTLTLSAPACHPTSEKMRAIIYDVDWMPWPTF
jgi:hypothetical protein